MSFGCVLRQELSTTLALAVTAGGVEAVGEGEAMTEVAVLEDAAAVAAASGALVLDPAPKDMHPLFA